MPSSESFNILVEKSAFNQINCNYANLRQFSLIWKPIFCGKSFSMNIAPSRTGRLLKSVSNTRFPIEAQLLHCQLFSNLIQMEDKLHIRNCFSENIIKSQGIFFHLDFLYYLSKITWKDKIIETNFSWMQISLSS